MADTGSRKIEILQAALDLPPAERRAFVVAECADDAVLLKQVQALLAADTQGWSLLDQPVDALVAEVFANTNDDADYSGNIGQLIGPWRLIRELGRGGMGSVWLAERADGAYSQEVALKTIKLGMDSAMVLAQFRRERNVLARLQHPNIASLIDGGVDERGRPWFAMDYVQGTGLLKWLHNRPSLPQRLHLFEKLCRAVAHAHQQLVIHRDIKPGNVLVQADGEPKLLDFGIAKLLEDDDTRQTTTLHRFASRGYAAPEQLRGEAVSTATDVYMLGALLFELLTGQRYARVHPADTAPTPPSKVAHASTEDASLPVPLLRGDLDAIVTRALAQEPERRYATALSLAEDVQNHLDGRPINARTDSFAYRVSKFIRRNRAAVAIAAFSVLGLLVTSGVAVWQAHAKAVEVELTKVALQRSEAIRDFIESVFLDADPSHARGENTTAGELLDAARGRVAKDLGNQPDIAATMLDQIGNVYVSLGKDDQARTSLQEALTMNARSAHPSLAVEASAGGRLAHYDYLDGHADRALAEFDRIISRLRTHADLSAELSATLQMKGNVLFTMGRSRAGLAAVAEAVSVLAPHADELGSEYAYALAGYADAAASQGEGNVALQAVERALALPLLQNDNAPALKLAVLGAKVRALQSLKRDAEAEPVLVEVIKGFSQQFGADAARTRYWVYRQAQVLQTLGRLDEAQGVIDGLLAQPPGSIEQPVAHSAYAIAAAKIAILRRAPDAAKRIVDAVAIACGPTGNAHFCENARSMKVLAD